MQPNQFTPDRNSQDVRSGARQAPRCYARSATTDDVDQARIDTQSAAALTVLSIVTCAAAFVVVH